MLRVIAIILFSIVAAFTAAGLGVMLLWNWLALGLFGAPHVNLLQAVGLVVTFIFLRAFLMVRVKINR
ncbi:hypothetical protein LCGC14_1705380 [marine sediment metagenome]|uniref:Uncharacterized protein n=1 Tax=marine sediment metagenome TaxID=412755 RepID=A0A0F9I4F4_9ZZZZ